MRRTEANQTAGERPPRHRINEIVSDVLGAAIELGALPSGGVLRNSVVAAAFEVSRAPIRRALARLERQGLVSPVTGGGYLIVGRAAGNEVLTEHRIRGTISPENRSAVRKRVWRDRIYGEIEREIAGCLMFGRFQIRSQALAEHYGVSRTVANEVMTRLERVGIIRRESNARWYAGPLTRQRLSELFEVRWLLEPTAIMQAANVVTKRQLVAMRDGVQRAIEQAPHYDPDLLHQLEQDLHHTVVLRCLNTEMRDILYRCQLPLIASHLAFTTDQMRPEVTPMLDAHYKIFESLIQGRPAEAAHLLEHHLRQSESAQPERMSRVPESRAKVPAYLTQL